MKILKLTALAMVTLLCLGSCKKENKSAMITPAGPGQKIEANGIHVPQAVFSSNSDDIAKLVHDFKQSTKQQASQARLISDPDSDLAYATSILEATLNFDHDANFNQNYDTEPQKIAIDIIVDANNKVNSDDVEAVYEQLNTWVTDKITADRKLLLIDIESYVDQSTGLGSIKAYAVFFLVNNVGNCNLPQTWSKYPVSAYNRNTPSPGCNGFQESSSANPNYSPSAIPDIKWMVNCSAVNMMECGGNGYYWFPLISHDLVGSPYAANQPAALYTSDHKAYNWSCAPHNLTLSDMAGFKTAIMAEAANNFPTIPGAWMVAIKIVTDNTNTYQPQGGNPVKAMYWDNLHIEYGVKKCHTNNG